MLLIQKIDLTWGKGERGAKYAQVRQRFPLAQPVEELRAEGEVAVQCLGFFQSGERVLDAFQETRQSLGHILRSRGCSEEQIRREVDSRLRWIRRYRVRSYRSTEELNLTNLLIAPCGEGVEVTFFYDEHRSGMPYRRGHNKDHCDPRSPLYGKDRLNETAFCLMQGQYGRIVWNERRTDCDTGGWYYQLHIYNLIDTGDAVPNADIFIERDPDFVYQQLAVLY